MVQIKYDPISRCKPRNNGIDFISISVRDHHADGGGGIGRIGGFDHGKENGAEGEQMKQRFKEGGGRVLSRKVVLVRARGDANTGPEGTYRATNVGRFSVHVT